MRALPCRKALAGQGEGGECTTADGLVICRLFRECGKMELEVARLRPPEESRPRINDFAVGCNSRQK